MPTAPRAALFDLDGTLADTFPHIIASVNAAMERVTGKTWTAQEVVSRFGVPIITMLKRELPEHLHESAIRAYLEHFKREHHTVKIFPGVKEMLEKLRAHNIPMAVVTGRGRLSCDITTEALGWRELFPCVISGDEMQFQKPHPCSALTAAAALRVDPSVCAFIGDSPADILCGKNAGMTTIAAVWHDEYVNKLKDLNPDHWAQHPADVLRVFGIE
jgi:pyrophosphatase PpaX